MNIFCLGINHRTAPIEAREQLWFSSDDLRTLLPAVLREGVPEAVLVSTCNRTELYYAGEEREELPAALRSVLAHAKESRSWLEAKYFYQFHGSHAVRHLFGLAAGRDSMVLGDIQILNQIKTAFSLAQELHTTGPVLHRLFTAAIHTGKRARTETGIAEGAVSVGYAAAELASKIFQDLNGKSALLIGTGETGALTARHLHAQNLGKLFITNRTRARAELLVDEIPGTVVDFERFTDVLPAVDIIISSLGATAPVLSAADLRAVMQQRRQRPLFIIDLGMPRNIDPAARTIPNVFLHDIDNLFQIVDKNLARRQAEIPAVNGIVLHEVRQYRDWYTSLRINPTIQELREQFESIRQAEVERYLGHFPADLRDEVALVTRRIVNKLLHVPTVNLRTGNAGRREDETVQTIELLRSLFDLDAGVSRSHSS